MRVFGTLTILPRHRPLGGGAIPLAPTRVLRELIVCVGFNPTGTKGVFVSRDAEASGHSLTGLPGRPGRNFTTGDWLIRVDLYQPKTADALTQQR